MASEKERKKYAESAANLRIQHALHENNEVEVTSDNLMHTSKQYNLVVNLRKRLSLSTKPPTTELYPLSKVEIHANETETVTLDPPSDENEVKSVTGCQSWDTMLIFMFENQLQRARAGLRDVHSLSLPSRKSIDWLAPLSSHPKPPETPQKCHQCESVDLAWDHRRYHLAPVVQCGLI